MLDIKDILKNEEKYVELLNRKFFDAKKEIKLIKKEYDKYLKLLKEEEKYNHELNLISKKIKELEKEKKKEFILKANNISKKSKQLKNDISTLKQEIDIKLSYFPNIPFENVKVGKNENENTVISEHLSELKKEHNIPHWEVIEKKNLILKNESNLISGSRYVIYGTELTLLIKALESYMLENNYKNGYKIVQTPVIVNEKMLFNTSNLPKFRDDLYEVGENKFLIPTSEVTLTNLVSNKILNKDELPLKFTSSTSCFRKEAGSAGKDTRGIMRLHQFNKVEIVKIGNPKNYKEDFEELLNTSKKILEDLKIPFRLVELCTGDMSFGSRKTVDIEFWLPSEKRYREISSVSVMGDFQARRMKTRFIDEFGNKIIPFTYNGSALAIDRTLIAIIENYLNEKGEIIVPDVLKKFLPFSKI